MTEEKDNPSVQEEGDAELTTLYVAYCDILGFSDRILTDFDNTLKTYRDFGKLVCGGETFKDVKTTMYSDAILLTATSLVRLLQAAQALLFFALAHDFMISRCNYQRALLGTTNWVMICLLPVMLWFEL